MCTHGRHDRLPKMKKSTLYRQGTSFPPHRFRPHQLEALFWRVFTWRQRRRCHGMSWDVMGLPTYPHHPTSFRLNVSPSSETETTSHRTEFVGFPMEALPLQHPPGQGWWRVSRSLGRSLSEDTKVAGLLDISSWGHLNLLLRTPFAII